MRDYELVFIVHPDIDDNAMIEIIDRVKGWITESGGTVVKEDRWGKRRLAYQIRKQRDGQYMFMQLQLSPSAAGDLNRNMRFLEPVMRFLITVVE